MLRTRGPKPELHSARLERFLRDVAAKPLEPIAKIAARHGISERSAYRYLQRARDPEYLIRVGVDPEIVKVNGRRHRNGS